jgi:PAS domain S-box-containing protein
MSWVTAIWSMVITGCLMLTGIHLLIWARERKRWSSLAFAISAMAVAGVAVAEFRSMHACSSQEIVADILWANVALMIMVGALVGFVRFSFGRGNLWIGGTAFGLHIIVLILLLAFPQRSAFPEGSALTRINFLGEQVTVIPRALVNPWWVLNFLSTVVFLVFVVDASIRLWHSDDLERRRRAIMIGGSIAVFFVVATGIPVLINIGTIQAPYLISFPFLLIVLIVAYELARDVLHGATLATILHENEERLHLAEKAVGFGTFNYNLVTGETSHSPELLALYGIPEDAVPKLDNDLLPESLLHEDKPEFLAAIRRAGVPGAARVFEAEFRVRRPDGSLRWLQARGKTTFSSPGRDGIPQRINGIVLDVTAQKDAEQEIHDIRSQLARADRISLLGHLASALTHELSQPLGAILRNAEAADLVLQQASPDLDELKNIVSDIQDDDRRASEIIAKTRALLKDQSIELQPVTLHDLIAKVVTLMRSDSAMHHIDINVDVPNDLPAVEGDRIHLQQVLLNLIINAMEALNQEKKPGAQIIIKARESPRGMVQVSVRDNGPGIPPESLQNIFEPFYTTKERGMGMGLALSQAVVHAHHGELWADAEATNGSTLCFTLPVFEKDQA